MHFRPMAINQKKSTRITVSMPSHEYSELVELSKKYDLSLSWLIRQAVADFISLQKGKENRLPLELPIQKKRVGK